MHHDILHLNIADSYDSLTLKELSGNAWILKNCPNVSYLISTDDDIYVNLPKLTSKLSEAALGAQGTQPFLLCT